MSEGTSLENITPSSKAPPITKSSYPDNRNSRLTDTIKRISTTRGVSHALNLLKRSSPEKSLKPKDITEMEKVRSEIDAFKTQAPHNTIDLDETIPSHRFSRRTLLRTAAGAAITTGLKGIPAKASGKQSTETVSSETSPQAETKFTSEEIDEILTFGSEKPLGGKDLEILQEKINSKEYSLEEDTYYGTMYATKEQCDFFMDTYGETFQEFLKRHEQRMEAMLVEAAAETDVDPIHFKIQQLIVVDENDDRVFVGSLSNSDGKWRFNPYNNPHELYDPKKSSYTQDIIDEQTSQPKIDDLGLLHEWGHGVLSLPDHYRLNVDEPILPKSLPIPEAWQKYYSTLRIDREDLMGICTPKFSEFTMRQLDRRKKTGAVHDKTRKRNDISGFYTTMPNEITFQFNNIDVAKGNPVLTLFKTIPASEDEDPITGKKRSTHLIFPNGDPHGKINTDGTITIPHELLLNTKTEMIGGTEGSFFILVADENDPTAKPQISWLDIRDFNIPYYKGLEEHATIAMDLASVDNDPLTYERNIQYSE